MIPDEILKTVNEIFNDVHHGGDYTLAVETTADDIEAWDSLTHIQFIVALEKRFNIRFTSSEAIGFKNVGHMCEIILKKKARN